MIRPSEKNGNISGFTIIELSIVIGIISVFIAMIVISTQSRIDAARIFTTKERMQLIITAFDRYVSTYGHLPCPASITLAKTDANYGISQTTAGATGSVSCTTNNIQIRAGAAGDTDDYVMGMIPFITLGLDSQVTVDGWGNRFDYNMTAAYSLTSNYALARAGNSSSGSSPGPMYGKNYTVKNTSGGATIASGEDLAYILVSHGQNGYGGVADLTAVQNPTTNITGNTNELENADRNESFIQTMPNVNYDDIVILKKTWDLPEYINKNY